MGALFHLGLTIVMPGGRSRRCLFCFDATFSTTCPVRLRRTSASEHHNSKAITYNTFVNSDATAEAGGGSVTCNGHQRTMTAHNQRTKKSRSHEKTRTVPAARRRCRTGIRADVQRCPRADGPDGLLVVQ